MKKKQNKTGGAKSNNYCYIIALTLFISLLEINIINAQSVESLSLYPNPFYDSLFIELNLTHMDSISIVTYSLSNGNSDTICSDSLLSSGYHFISMNLSSLPNGMYFIKNYFNHNEMMMYRVNKEDKPLYISNLSKDDSQLLLYPNPSRGEVYFLGVELAKVEVFDFNGRKILFEIINSGNFKLNTSPGMYVVQITDLKNGDVSTNMLQVIE